MLREGLHRFYVAKFAEAKILYCLMLTSLVLVPTVQTKFVVFLSSLIRGTECHAGFD